MTRGRKSNASLEALLVDVKRKASEPPADLQSAAASTFNQIVASVEPYHFCKSCLHARELRTGNLSGTVLRSIDR